MKKTFTTQNSVTDLLDASPVMPLFLAKEILSFIPEEYLHIPICDWKEPVMMPWGLPFPVMDALEDANMAANPDEYWDIVPLWVSDGCTPASNDLNSVSLMILKGQSEGRRPAVIVCPGGAYENLAVHSEGLLTARRMIDAGYRTFILDYRVKPNHYPLPQLDLALAIAHIRANAEKYDLDPDDVMILGYSAGGHLCASEPALADELQEELQKALTELRPELAEEYKGISVRPDKVCLCYPVISFLSEQHEDSFQNLSGGDESLRERLSIEKRVTSSYPKTFVWTCDDDSLVPPSNALRMGKALAEAGVPHLLRHYPQGEHGCSVGTGTSAEGWMDEMLAFMKD